MHQQWRHIQESQKETPLRRIEKLHPHKMLVLLGAMGSGLISLFLLAGFLVTRYQVREELLLPKGFIFGVIVLLFSCFLVHRVLLLFQQDRFQQVLSSLGIALFLGVTFAFSQYFAWKELLIYGVEFNEESAGSYIYFLSGVHLVQVIAVLAYMSYLLFDMWKVSLDPVKSLIMSTNPYQKIKLEILSWSWNFLSFGWLLIFLIFLFTI